MVPAGGPGMGSAEAPRAYPQLFGLFHKVMHNEAWGCDGSPDH